MLLAALTSSTMAEAPKMRLPGIVNFRRKSAVQKSNHSDAACIFLVLWLQVNAASTTKSHSNWQLKNVERLCFSASRRDSFNRYLQEAQRKLQVRRRPCHKPGTKFQMAQASQKSEENLHLQTPWSWIQVQICSSETTMPHTAASTPTSRTPLG